MGALQTEIEARGERIFNLVDQHPESLFSKAGFYQRMMALSMRDENFKVQMFRFVEVLPSLRKSGDVVQHLEEYFAGMRDGFAPVIQTGCASRASSHGSVRLSCDGTFPEWRASLSP